MLVFNFRKIMIDTASFFNAEALRKLVPVLSCEPENPDCYQNDDGETGNAAPGPGPGPESQNVIGAAGPIFGRQLSPAMAAS